MPDLDARGVIRTRGSINAEVQISTRCEQRVRWRKRVAGIGAFLLVVSAIATVARSSSDAPTPDQGGSTSVPAAGSDGPHDATLRSLPARPNAPAPSDRRRKAMWCRECGVIESMRQIESTREMAEHYDAHRRALPSLYGGEIEPASGARDGAARHFEFIVRFRDGRTQVFSETTPRSWQTGSRVMVIAGATESGK